MSRLLKYQTIALLYQPPVGDDAYDDAGNWIQQPIITFNKYAIVQPVRDRDLNFLTDVGGVTSQSDTRKVYFKQETRITLDSTEEGCFRLKFSDGNIERLWRPISVDYRQNVRCRVIVERMAQDQVNAFFKYGTDTDISYSERGYVI